MAAHKAAKAELLQDGFPSELAGVELRGDLYWDSMALAQAAYESLGLPEAWADIATFNKEQMREEARHVYFFGGGATAFEVAVLVACGKPDPTPTLASLDPATAVCSDPVDITMKCIGTGFTQESEIYFGYQPERTDFVSDTEISTIVKPSLFPNPDANIQVFVRTPTLMDTASLPFAFTLAGSGTQRRLPEQGREKQAREEEDERKRKAENEKLKLRK